MKRQPVPVTNVTRPQRGVRPVIVAAVDGGPGSTPVLEAAGRLARNSGAIVVVAHAQPTFATTTYVSGDALVDLRQDLEIDVMTRSAQVLDRMGVSWRLECGPGDPSSVVHTIAETYQAGLVILGTRGCGPRAVIRRLVRRSVSGHLIHHEHRPVLVVPTNTRPSAP